MRAATRQRRSASRGEPSPSRPRQPTARQAGSGLDSGVLTASGVLILIGVVMSYSATAALADLERVYPGFTIATFREEVAYWQTPPDFVERAVAVLRKAGLAEGN